MRLKLKLYEKQIECKNQEKRSKVEIIKERKVRELTTEIVNKDIGKVMTERSIEEIEGLSFTLTSKFERAGLQISEISNIIETQPNLIKPRIEEELNSLFKKLRLANQQELILREHFVDLKEILSK